MVMLLPSKGLSRMRNRTSCLLLCFLMLGFWLPLGSLLLTLAIGVVREQARMGMIIVGILREMGRPNPSVSNKENIGIVISCPQRRALGPVEW